VVEQQLTEAFILKKEATHLHCRFAVGQGHRSVRRSGNDRFAFNDLSDIFTGELPK
jgi:hypothetical protein